MPTKTLANSRGAGQKLSCVWQKNWQPILAFFAAGDPQHPLKVLYGAYKVYTQGTASSAVVRIMHIYE